MIHKITLTEDEILDIIIEDLQKTIFLGMSMDRATLVDIAKFKFKGNSARDVDILELEFEIDVKETVFRETPFKARENPFWGL